jgi:hypothetical protein
VGVAEARVRRLCELCSVVVSMSRFGGENLSEQKASLVHPNTLGAMVAARQLLWYTRNAGAPRACMGVLECLPSAVAAVAWSKTEDEVLSVRRCADALF